MNKYIVGGIIIAVLGALLFLNSPNSENPKTKKIGPVASVISFTKDTYDFGDIDIFGGKVQTTYTIKNDGTEDVVILSAVTSCSCTEGQIGKLTFGMHESSGERVTIPAGGEKTLTATFNPLAHGPNAVGKIKRELILKTNSTVTPQVVVSFRGDVIKKDTKK